MFALLIIAIMGIALAALAGYSLLTIHHATDSVSSSRQNASYLEQATQILQASLRDVTLDGTLRPPMGALAPEGWTTLPAWISTYNKTPWGVSYGYCPYAPDNTIALGSSAIVQGDLTEYAVNTLTNSITGGQPYVTASEAPPVAGVLAFIVAPELNSAILPNCTDITYQDGRYSVPGGSVRAITKGATFSNRLSAAATSITFHVAPITSGDGSGSTPENAATLNSALSLWRAVLPEDAKLILAAGTYELSDLEANLGAEPASKYVRKSLSIVGAGINDTTIAPPDTETFVLSIPGITLSLEGLAFAQGGALSAQENDLTVRNVALPAMVLERTRAQIKNTVALYPTSSVTRGLTAKDSTISLDTAVLSITPSSGSAGSILLQDSTMTDQTGSTVTVYTPSGTHAIELDGLSGLSLRGTGLDVGAVSGTATGMIKVGKTASLNVSNNAVLRTIGWVSQMVLAQGRTQLNSAILTPLSGASRYVRLERGGELSMDASTLGSTTYEASNGISDGGAGRVDGGTSNVFTSLDCWVGNLFSFSDNANYGSSAPAAEATDVVKQSNKSTWTCRR